MNLSHATLPLWDDQSDAQQRTTLHAWVQALYRHTYADAFRVMRVQLLTHQPADDKEATDIALILDLMDQHAMIFSPLCAACHFTGSALVLDGDGRFLLHHHKKLDRWLQFGGHPDNEVDMTLVALREATEESGLPDLIFWGGQPTLIDVDVHTIPATTTRPEHLHLDLRYVLQTQQPNAVNPPSGESARLAWLGYDDIQTNTLQLDSALHRLINKAHRLFQEQ